MSAERAIVVFSHLRWNYVYQRPQHLLSRLASNRRVLFVEEPAYDPASPDQWRHDSPAPNIDVYQATTASVSCVYGDQQIPALREMVSELLTKERIDDYIAWFYTPMAAPLLDVLRPQAVAYDCMDELSSFMNAPRQLLDREAELLQRCDVVFTGGPSLYRAKKNLHPNVHCVPSSVDVQHFEQARQGIAEPSDQAALAHPRLGYYGVIDERIDLPLIAALAEQRPNWQIIMVGPVAKIDRNKLPRSGNLHYFGMRSYSELPNFLAGWEVSLLPFALNQATRFISPTKVLEYMVAERPIVTTPITDVIEPYGDIVYCGDTIDRFVAECEAALNSNDAERNARALRMRRVLAETSWDRTAQRVDRLLRSAVDRRARQQAAVAAHHGRATSRSPSRISAGARESSELSSRGSSFVGGTTERADVVIVGAGPTGLSAAYHVGSQAVLLEQNDQVGGWCRSLEVNGFTFDYAGHIMFSKDEYVHQLYQMLLGDNVHWQDREAWIYSHGVYTRYPFQGALYGLPPQVIKECILGAIEARFGPLKSQTPVTGNGAPLGQSTGNGHHASGNPSTSNGVPSNGNAGTCSPGAVSDCCADGVLESTARLGLRNASNGDGQPANFEEFIYNVWGAGIAKHFAIPYNKKLWAVPLREMETSWLGGRVPLPDLEEMIEGALQPVAKPMGPNSRFGYPLRGGFQALMDGFLPHVKDQLRLNTRVAAVSPGRRMLTLEDGTRLRFDALISTMPLPVLVRLMGDEAPREVQQASARLRYVSVRCVHLGVGRENLTEKHWIYYPESTVFHRIFVQGNASPHCNPPGGFGLTCEITYSEYKPLPCDGQALIDRCIRDCHAVGIFRPDDPVWAAAQVDMPHAYVVYDHTRPESVATIRNWLATQNIFLAGRYSEWEYYNSDHAFVAGKRAAETVLQLQAKTSAGPTRAELPTGTSLHP